MYKIIFFLAFLGCGLMGNPAAWGASEASSSSPSLSSSEVHGEIRRLITEVGSSTFRKYQQQSIILSLQAVGT